MLEAVRLTLGELFANRKRLIRLAHYDVKKSNSETTFGFIWNVLNPALQVFVYWFVFSIGLNQSSPRDGYPYILWMMMGIMPWFFISAAMANSANSIISYGGVLKQIKLPLAIMPAKAVFSAFISHLWAMALVLVIFLCCGYRLGWCACLVFYFMACAICFLVGFGLFASSITVVFRDFQKFLSSIIRLLFYLTPVVWVQDHLPAQLRFILRLNPLAYIVDGYRESLLYNQGLQAHWKQGLYFWIVTCCLYALGSSIHLKLRNQLIDLV